MGMNKVHVMVGNIGSGKSSTVNALRDELRPYSYILFNYDSLVVPLSGGVYETVELDGGSHSLKHRKIFEEMQRAGVRAAVRHGKDAIVDDCNMTRAFRKTMIDIALDEGAMSIFHYHDCGRDLERRLQDPRGTPSEVWIDVWRMFENMWDPISIDEGMDVLITYDGYGKVINVSSREG